MGDWRSAQERKDSRIRSFFRVEDWSLRTKAAMLLVVASLAPLGVTAVKDIRDARAQAIVAAQALLAARGDQLVGTMDAFHRGYERSAARFALMPAITAFCRATGETAASLEPAARAVLQVQPAADRNVRGAALLDLSGRVAVATEPQLVGLDLSFHRYVKDALRGHAVISDIHLAEPEAGSSPTIAYVHPVHRADRSVCGFLVLWVRATALWDLAKATNELAGPKSFAVLFDHDGVRIAHTYSDEIVFHPGGALGEATIDGMVAERRFGARTRELLLDIRPFPQQFDRARGAAVDRSVFRGLAPVNHKWNFGVARRLDAVPWTLFYMLPEDSLNAKIAAMTVDKVVFAIAIMVAALLIGLLFAQVILNPLRALWSATEIVATGDFSARVHLTGRRDELGRLSESFNAMAIRIDSQASALGLARDELETKVRERTAELTRTTESLRVEVADRRRAEDVARVSEADLRITLDSIGDAVIATDTAGRIIRMNPVAEQLTGWAFREARDRGLDEVFVIINEDTGSVLESPVARVLREGTVVGPAHHTVLVSRDGIHRAIADGGAPIRDALGNIRGVVLVFRDQSEERKAERALRKSEARKAAVMEAALDGIVMMDHEGRITEFNPAAEKTFGYSREDAMGRSLADVMIPPALRSEHRNGLLRYLATGDAHILGKRIEVSAMTRSGVEFPAEVAVVRIRSDGPAEFTGYVRDITERRRAAEADLLGRAKEAADEANAELEAFSSSVAHDLRAPLRAINGFAGGLVEDHGARLGPEATADLNRVTAAAVRMSELIDALLSLARLTRTEPRRETVDLTRLAYAVMEQLRASEPSRALEFVATDGLVAQGDPQLLRAVFENLLGNAWKFTGKRGRARIEFGRQLQSDVDTYFVRDNGAGFDMAHADKLFAPFRRLHSSDDFEGTGLGLATVQRIVRRHGGRVWADGAEDRGATFYFTLSVSTPTGERSWMPTS